MSNLHYLYYIYVYLVMHFGLLCENFSAVSQAAAAVCPSVFPTVNNGLAHNVDARIARSQPAAGLGAAGEGEGEGGWGERGGFGASRLRKRIGHVRSCVCAYV